jgi:hypothetical protein
LHLDRFERPGWVFSTIQGKESDVRAQSLTLVGAGLLAGLLFYGTPALAGQAATPPMHGHSMPTHGQHVGRLDLNSASPEELQHVPGISAATAKKIVENRPYARADELITKKILSKTAYDGIKDHIVVTRPGSK